MKFVIKDSKGKKYLAKSTTRDDSENPFSAEIVGKVKEVIDIPVDELITDAKEELSADDIKSLKTLAEKVDKLLALVNEDEAEEDEEDVVDFSNEDDSQNDEDLEETDEEVDIDEDIIGDSDSLGVSDSAKSFGSIENQKASVILNDNAQEAIVNAWKNRKKF